MADTLTLRAPHVLVSPGQVIADGAVVIRGKQIEAVDTQEKISPAGQVIDLKNAILLPGLINAHTHLELTELEGKLPEGPDFPRWVTKLVTKTYFWSQRKSRRSAERGVHLSAEAGTTTVGDISRNGQSLQITDPPLRKVVLKEVIDFLPEHAETVAKQLREEIDKVVGDPLLKTGISPHSPYTVSTELYKECANIADDRDVLLATHVAETRDEIKFLTSGTGKLVELMQRARMLSPDWHPPGLTPVRHLKELGILNRPRLLVHANYVDDEEMDIIRDSGSSVVYCPRSHHFFRHEPHPLREMLGKNINVALGTDSLASNHSLSMLDEMRFLREHRQDISPETILQMATVNGAKALGLEKQIGTLEPGKMADVIAISCEDTDSKDLLSAILSPGSRHILTMIDGAVCLRE